MSYRFGKLWHLAIIWTIRKAFQCILQGVRILLAKYTRISPTSENESYILLGKVTTLLEFQSVFRMGGEFASWLLQLVSFSCGWFLQIFLLCNFLKIKKKVMWKKSSKGDLSPCFARYDIHVFIGKSHKLLFHNFPFTQSYAITIKWDFERDCPNNA